MRRTLDLLYRGCGGVAACFLIAIAALTFLSIATRFAGIYIAGLTDYAGYTMAAASFFALAYTFGHGGHIRVNLVIGRFRGGARRIAELWCLGAGTFIAGYLAYYCVKMTVVSFELGDLSEGSEATPLWIPQTSLAIGSIVFAIAVLDRFVAVAAGEPIETTAGVETPPVE